MKCIATVTAKAYIPCFVLPGRCISEIAVLPCFGMALDLYAEEELSSSEDDMLPEQDSRISSCSPYYSGDRNAVPLMRDDSFSTMFQDTVFIESCGLFGLNEYNFGQLFEDYGTVCLEFKLPMYKLFNKILQHKWPDHEFECEKSLYYHKGIAVIDFPNIDYWPALLAWFARQCLVNGIKFFDYCKLHEQETEGTEYGEIFA